MVHSFIIEPAVYIAFDSEAEQIDKCKEWGLLSEKASKTKTFVYKGNGMNLTCSMIGYADKMTAVIEFDNKQRHCIHPSYLKEMQAANYGQKLSASAEQSVEPESAEADGAEPQRVERKSVTLETPQEAAPSAEEAKPELEEPKVEVDKAEEPAKAKTKKAPKPQLPDEKVRMVATVKEFTTVPNHFSDTEDEVVIYEEVSIEEPETEIGSAWSSHSATLKKLELEIGDKIKFEGKIVAKKLTKHPVPYKINNPAKIQVEKA